MKRIALVSYVLFLAQPAISQVTPPGADRTESKDSFYLLSPVEVKAIRASEKAPFTKTNISKAEIQKNNLGQDIPFIISQTPSVVVNSDAGNGIGYTGLRIRGTDATRINITLNGIPYNDAESQGTFLVNLPDFSSSVNSIQVQRGVGTSSNGTGAFGATLSLSTNEVNKESYAEINNSFGSFNSWKNTLKAGTGLIDQHFTVDARLSRISSNGFIDRASSDLQAFYISGAYLDKKSSLRLNIFSGKEKTFQAWNGIPEAKLKGDQDALLTHYYNNLGSLYFTSDDSVNLFHSGKRTYNLPLYKNETDNYRQTHYQLFFSHQLNEKWNFNTAAFLTRGLGYYENFKQEEKFSKYGLPDLVIGGTIIKRTDLIRQKWLDNYFYGQLISAIYRHQRNSLTIGGSWTVYDGNHHGNVIWAQYNIPNDYRYYNLDAIKTDINSYVKWEYQLTPALNLFTDLQYKHVNHRMTGFENNPVLVIDRRFDFFNPKFGLLYSSKGWQAYLSYAVANKEPNRDDFEAGLQNQPKQETLHDFEAGIEKRTALSHWGGTLYYMLYKNQLVLTGRINDVGAYTRTNVPGSYRTGLELQGGYRISHWLEAAGNLSISKNKIRSFTQYLDDYDSNFEWIGQKGTAYRHTDIAFSPRVVGGATLTILPAANMELSLSGKYVSRQYLDNSQDVRRKLDAYYTQDARLVFTVKNKLFSEWKIIGQVNNLLNAKYEPNGYTYGYIYDGTAVNENFYFPMAGIHFMVALNIKL